MSCGQTHSSPSSSKIQCPLSQLQHSFFTRLLTFRRWGGLSRFSPVILHQRRKWQAPHCDAGMSEEQIAAMKEYDWAWFSSQRVFQNHTQPIPCEQYDEVCGQSQLFRKFASLSYQWDVDKIDQTRYGWLASVENEQLLLRLKKLSKKDLELLTLLFVDGYGLTAPKKRNPKSSAKNPGDSANGKEKEIDEG